MRINLFNEYYRNDKEKEGILKTRLFRMSSLLIFCRARPLWYNLDENKYRGGSWIKIYKV
ncbi:hypothetical protein A3781_17740 [Bacillus badius]|nr:hypothetical protein A3781_17740 [Bacillus badius]